MDGYWHFRDDADKTQEVQTLCPSASGKTEPPQPRFFNLSDGWILFRMPCSEANGYGQDW